MPRRQRITITHGQRELARARAATANPRQRLALDLLRELRRDQSATVESAAKTVGVPVRTARRWLAMYREGGLESIAALGASGRRVTMAIEDELAALITRGDLDSAPSVRRWLADRHQLRLSLPSVVALVERIGARHFGRGPIDAAALDWVVPFLGAIPLRLDSRAWTERLREALARALGVGHVSIDVNVEAVRPRVEDPERMLAITSHVSGHEVPVETAVAGVEGGSDEYVRSLLASMKEGGFPLGRYRRPHIEVYRSEDGTYLGTLLAWQTRTSTPMSDHTVKRLRSWAPIIGSLLADCSARHQAMNPLNNEFYLALDRLSADARLTPTEHRVLTLRLLGESYKSIADRLHVHVDTVGNHLSAVYRKSHTSGFAELYARYFTPRL